MAALSRMQAEAFLRTARGGRPLYDDLRPGYTRLDPLVALLRRRGFSGILYAAGKPGEGMVWFDRGRLHSGWLLAIDATEVTIQHDDPLGPLRALWEDVDATVSVHPGRPPAGVGEGVAETATPVRPAATPRTAAVAPAAAPIPPPVRSGPPPEARAATLPAASPPRRSPGRMAPARGAARSGAGAIPWERFLPEALARVRRHRGTPLAEQLQAAVNQALAPDAYLEGRDLKGPIAPEKAVVALREIVEGLRRVAGGVFTERLLGTLARDFACEEALGPMLRPESEGDG